MIRTKPKTTAVVWMVSLRVGQTTRLASSTDSRAYAKKLFTNSGRPEHHDRSDRATKDATDTYDQGTLIPVVIAEETGDYQGYG